MKTAIVCVLLAFVVARATAFCIIYYVKSSPYKWRNGSMEYCEYKKFRFMLGSEFTDADACLRCECYKYGLHCCGVGIYAGVVHHPGCQVVSDNCEMAILNMNKTALCNP